MQRAIELSEFAEQFQLDPGGTRDAIAACMAGVRDHSELDCWQLSDQLEHAVAQILERPGFRRYPGLHDQLTRSSEGPAPQIAEGFSRYYPKENAPFVRIAKSSLTETIVHLSRVAKKGIITKEECASLTTLARRARGATTQYLLYLESAPPPPPGKRKRRARSEPPAQEP